MTNKKRSASLDKRLNTPKDYAVIVEIHHPRVMPAHIQKETMVYLESVGFAKGVAIATVENCCIDWGVKCQ